MNVTAFLSALAGGMIGAAVTVLVLKRLGWF
jgi:hypothetical protein